MYILDIYMYGCIYYDHWTNICIDLLCMIIGPIYVWLYVL